MARHDARTPAPGRTATQTPLRVWLGLLLVLAGLWLWGFWQDASPSLGAVRADARPPAQATQAGQAWPFGTGSAPAAVPSTMGESPWARLSRSQPQKAQAFLDHVVPMPGNRYARAGLQAGDTVYSLDVPGKPVIDESNVAAMTSVQVLRFEVVRRGTPILLPTRLDHDAPDQAATATP